MPTRKGCSAVSYALFRFDALAKDFRPIVRIVTGFTIAHSITLSLAALGVVDVPARIVEPLIAATIIWVALENLVAPTQTRWRWLIAAVFGLVHGLGFASALTELGLPREARCGRWSASTWASNSVSSLLSPSSCRRRSGSPNRAALLGCRKNSFGPGCAHGRRWLVDRVLL